MELKEFIKQTITDIKDAISELNQESESDNAVVTPQNIDDLKHPKTEGTHRNVTDIQFDLSLSVMEEKGKEGKLGVMNSIVSLGGTAKTGATHEVGSAFVHLDRVTQAAFAQLSFAPITDMSEDVYHTTS